jgi:fido (protein-threonine AMPylation protein)
MATPNEKLASSLAQLKKLQSKGRRVFMSRELGRTHRERLIQQGFVREVIKGWLISTSPNAAAGDTTPWYACFWEFCGGYCRERFGSDWHLSPEQSLLLHAESTVIPAQVVVYSLKGTNNTIQLLFGTSFYDLKQPRMPPQEDLIDKNGLRLFTAPAALVKVTQGFFQRSPVEAQVALASVRDASEILGRLLDGGHSGIAGRLAGAFRRVGRSEVADEIVKTMKGAGYDVRETDPFAPKQNFTRIDSGTPPIIGRLRVMWEAAREAVIAAFPASPGLPSDQKRYLQFVEGIYESDAYHSLSLEGYSVTPELIDRVRTGSWNPEENKADRESRDALAARGYWQAFQQVEQSVAKIIAGADAGALVRTAHRDWYRELFQPSVAAGLLRPSALAGYRTQPVFLRGSRHVPPRAETVPDAMTAFFDLIEQEPEASVRAVLGHWLFGYIHPYPDGNGRTARFVMNAMLASGGYPWTVVRVEDRTTYLETLESASVETNLQPFARFIAERVRWSVEKAA